MLVERLPESAALCCKVLPGNIKEQLKNPEEHGFREDYSQLCLS